MNRIFAVIIESIFPGCLSEIDSAFRTIEEAQERVSAIPSNPNETEPIEKCIYEITYKSQVDQSFLEFAALSGDFYEYLKSVEKDIVSISKESSSLL